MEQLPLLPVAEGAAWEPGARAICVPGPVGSPRCAWSCLMVDRLPDLGLLGATQVYPRWRYGARMGDRVSNILPAAVAHARRRYGDPTITADDLWDLVYGVLHAPDYRRRFETDLWRGPPRIPHPPDWRLWAAAGRRLGDLHVGYESCPEYPLRAIVCSADGRLPAEHLRIERPMRYADEGRTIVVTDHVRLTGIPAEAHRYEVNGKSPLGWFITMYRITRDQQSGIVNDPADWWDQPIDLIHAIRRVVHVAAETTRIVEGLPPALAGV